MLRSVDMDPAELRLRMIRRGAAVVVVLYTWLLVRIRSLSRPSITYAPMSVRDEQCQNNLAYIFNSTDTQCVELLRMRRAPFYQLCDLFRSRELLKDPIHLGMAIAPTDAGTRGFQTQWMRVRVSNLTHGCTRTRTRNMWVRVRV